MAGFSSKAFEKQIYKYKICFAFTLINHHVINHSLPENISKKLS